MNTIIFRFANHPNKAFYQPLPSIDEGVSIAVRQSVRKDVKSIVERSLRETKMQKSVGIDALEKLVKLDVQLQACKSQVRHTMRTIEGLIEEQRRSDSLVCILR